MNESPGKVPMKQPNRRWLWGGISLPVFLVAIQLVPYGRDHANPPMTAEPIWDSPSTRDLAKNACFDCHSNETLWPPYASIAPVSWLVQRDVDEGRKVLNFSEWHRPQKEAGEAAKEVREREMPPFMYRLMHAGARLNAADLERLATGLAKTLGAAPGNGNGSGR
jgi:hypothetical protein